MPEERQACSRIDPLRLKRVTGTYRDITAGTVDGFHPRQFSLLILVGLHVRTIIYEAVEGLGLFPRALSFAIVQLLPKPKG